MKRLLIAAALLLVVVAVTYIKSVRGTDQRREAFEQGKTQTDQQLSVLQQDVDSLKELLRLRAENFDDSLARRDGLYREEISRLVGYLDSVIPYPQSKPKTQEKRPPAKKPKSKPEAPEVIEQAAAEEPAVTQSKVELVEPEKSKTDSAVTPSKVELVEPKKQPAKPVKSTKPSQEDADHSDLHENVLTFYGKLYDNLPKDLTSQERKVALYEISIKTAAEHSISMYQLKAICKNYYLSY